MRVTDLARKLGLTTDDLRARLPSLKISRDAKDIETTRALEIFEQLKGTAASAPVTPTEEEGPALMGMMFDDEPTGLAIEEPAAETPAVTTVEETTETNAEKEEVVEIQEKSEPAEQTTRAPIVETPTPVAPPPPPPRPGFVRTATSARTTADLTAARERWAAAKRASEKIIEQKKTAPKVAGQPVAGRALPDRRGRGRGRGAADHEPEVVVPRGPKKMAELVIDRTKPKKQIALGDVTTIREYAEKIGISPIRVIAELFKQGVMTNVNSSIDYDTAALAAETFWCEAVRDTTAVSGEDLLKGNIEKLLVDEPENLSPRAPIVAVMGHVDHGKTTLLDYIRKANVAGGEAGGITQHIGAYQVEVTTKDMPATSTRKITFLDTPGHEAFTAIRARGARATDIAVLVVAADDGVKPQTLEALAHARDAGVPIVVAITKADKPDANIERVKNMLSEHDLIPSDWGGKTEMVPVSGKTGAGVMELLEIILLANDLEPVTANPHRLAVGTIIESHLNKSLGPVATIIVNTGTLSVGDNFIIGSIVGRVKKLLDWNGKSIKSAEPGMPVRVAGLPELPSRGVGEIFQVFPDPQSARKKAEEFARLLELKSRQKVTSMSQIISRINTGVLKELKIVLKADVEGSLEAIRMSIDKVATKEVRPKIIHAGVGDVSETDVLMAEAADALLLAFHVGVPPHVAKAAERDGVTIRRHTIIYNLIDEVQKMLTGLLDPEIIETALGSLEVRGVFLVKPAEQIVGGLVTDGILENHALIRIHRGDKIIAEGKLTGLKREKEDVKTVAQNHECGLRVAVKGIKIEVGDIIEAYKIEKRIRTA